MINFAIGLIIFLLGFIDFIICGELNSVAGLVGASGPSIEGLGLVIGIVAMILGPLLFWLIRPVVGLFSKPKYEQPQNYDQGSYVQNTAPYQQPTARYPGAKR